MDERAGPPILITGASGTLGQALAGACRLRGLHQPGMTHLALSSEEWYFLAGDSDWQWT